MKISEIGKILILILPILIAALLGYFGVGILLGGNPDLEFLQYIGACALAIAAWYLFIVRKV